MQKPFHLPNLLRAGFRVIEILGEKAEAQKPTSTQPKPSSTAKPPSTSKPWACLTRIDGKETLYLTKNEEIIGRDSRTCTLVVDGTPGKQLVISHKHLSIRLNKKKIAEFKDLNSTNGTYINGQKKTSGVLHHKDIIVFCDSKFFDIPSLPVDGFITLPGGRSTDEVHDGWKDLLRQELSYNTKATAYTFRIIEGDEDDIPPTINNEKKRKPNDETETNKRRAFKY